MLYAEVLLPLPLADTFTYCIPEAMVHLAGLYGRVIVPFGQKHYYTGLVIEMHNRCPQHASVLKEIHELFDGKPVIREAQLHFWRWVSSYYLCTLGEVYRAALPSGLKIGSATLNKGFKPKKETFLRFSDHIQTETDLHGIMDELKRVKQQEKLFIDFQALSGNGLDKQLSKKVLLDYSGCHVHVLNALIKKNILVAEEKTVSRIDLPEKFEPAVPVLSPLQQQAFEELKQTFITKDITLLHSMMADFKPAIFIRMIQEVMSKGASVLYLLPEISLTKHVSESLRKAFGPRLLVYNSGISDNERVEIWNRLLQSDEPAVVLGARSSVFLPFARIGLVIVDEEQDPSYKQQDPAPRYHGRNAALMLAQQYGAKTLLGSSTPSLESWLWVQKGKYGYVKADKLPDEYLFPAIEIVNVSELRRKKQMKDGLFSPILKEKMEEALSKGEQVVLFQNRRGFAPFVACRECETIPNCMNCDVSLTYHKQMHRLICHYCGYSIPFPFRCPSCGNGELKMQGYGTEKIEEEVASLFPSAKVARMDLDTVRTENTYRRLLSDFEAGKTQILIGTQMISKGLDLTNVSVVGLINVDGMMNIPDFRAYERTFQQIFQLGECTVRRERSGSVVIQTSQAQNPLLHMVKHWDYPQMAQTQLMERHQFQYPPYTRLIMLILRSINEQTLDEVAGCYVHQLKTRFGSAISGPVYPPVMRIHAMFVRKIMLKLDFSKTVFQTRKDLEEVRIEMQKNPLFRQVILHYDVDPH